MKNINAMNGTSRSDTLRIADRSVAVVPVFSTLSPVGLTPARSSDGVLTQSSAAVLV